MALATAASALFRRANLALSLPYVAPDGEFETLIAKLFAEVLNLDHVGANDDFSELGGDSLLGEVLSTLISERTGFNFEIPLLVEHGSPRRIIALLRTKGVGRSCVVSSEDAGIPGRQPLSPEIEGKIRALTSDWKGERSTPDALLLGMNRDG